MKPKIIIISIMPFVKGAYHNYAFDEYFVNDGYTFEYWSLCDVFTVLTSSKETASNVKYFNSIKKVCSSLKNEKQKVVCFLQVPLIPKTLTLYTTCVKITNKTIILDYVQGALEFQKVEVNKKTKIIDNIKIKNIPKKILQKATLLYYKYSKISNKITTFYVSSRATKDIFSLNHLDYELFNENKNQTPLFAPNSYIVFADIGLTTHPDLVLKNISTMDKKVYLQKMNNYFDLIEKQYNKKVIIASHPKANYSLSDFNGREIVVNKTSQLIQNCSFVLYHISTSISFAVINKKPMVFLVMDEFLTNTPYFKNLYQSMLNQAIFFDAPLINIDDTYKNNILFDLKICDSKYEYYLNNYILSLNQDTSNYQKILNFIND